MKKITLILVLFFFSCERIRISESELSGTFKAVLVKEDNFTVYDEVNSNNIVQGYSKFRLTFNSENKVNLIEHTSESFNGNWEIVSNNSNFSTLKLFELQPKPDGTDGIIEFEILTKSTNYLKIKLKKSSLKTGNTINEYLLQKI